MTKDITRYDLLISCPGDIQEELQIIEEVICQFNEQFSDTTGVMIRSKHWSKSSFSESGGKPQALLNKQFVNDCDAAIAVFWTRFGTPTDQYGSGSEEEIEIMLDAGKQVFMGFSEREINPQKIDHEQYKKVSAFREKYKDRGLYFTYSTIEEFRKTVFAHLTKFFLTKKDLDEIKAKKAPDLKIKSISDGKLCDSLTISKFKPVGHKLKDQMLEEVVELYTKIASYQLPQPQKLETQQVSPDSAFNSMFEGATSAVASFLKPKCISVQTQEMLKEFAKHLELSLPIDFFYLGNLQENSLSGLGALGGGSSLVGTDDEKSKYYEIDDLHTRMIDIIDWFPFENTYSELSSIKLALVNDGTTFDEDIEVKLIIPSNYILAPCTIALPSVETMEYAYKHLSLDEIFGIPQTVEYEAYSQISNLSLTPPIGYDHNFDLFSSQDYEADFIDTLDSIFDYGYYVDNDCVILKIHFDYLKHHNAMAFPSVIFVDESLSNIEYTITSKHNSDVVKGSISIS